VLPGATLKLKRFIIQPMEQVCRQILRVELSEWHQSLTSLAYQIFMIRYRHILMLNLEFKTCKMQNHDFLNFASGKELFLQLLRLHICLFKETDLILNWPMIYQRDIVNFNLD